MNRPTAERRKFTFKKCIERNKTCHAIGMPVFKSTHTLAKHSTMKRIYWEYDYPRFIKNVRDAKNAERYKDEMHEYCMAYSDIEEQY